MNKKNANFGIFVPKGVLESRWLTISYIQVIVCEFYKAPYSKLFEKTRKREISGPRQVCMFLATILTKRSGIAIGKHFNRTDATVIHAVKTVKGFMDTYPEYKRNISDLAQNIINNTLEFSLKKRLTP
jgi:chromosomal replication initiation ATPase DnaA